MKKRYSKNLIIFIPIFLLLIILNVLKFNTFFAELYTKTINNILLTFIGFFSNMFYFSFFEIVFLSMIILSIIMIVFIIINIFKKKYKTMLDWIFKLITYVMLICLIYTSTSGVAYYRNPLPLPMYEEKISDELLNNAINYYIDDYNTLSKSFKKDENNASIMPYSFNEMASIMEKEMERLDEFDYFNKYIARPKASWFSPILSELHITGVDFSFTSEANINSSMPSIDIPFTMAHEVAHLKGVMREDDANAVALYICITSSNPYVRYSGYFRGFFRLLEIKKYTNPNDYIEILNNIDENIWNDNSYYNDYFEKHDLLKKISTFINDLYLNINGQKDGTGSYDDKSDTIISGKDDNGYEIREYLNYSPYQKIMIQYFIEVNS